MKTSELIKRLQELIEINGNLDVTIADAEGNYWHVEEARYAEEYTSPDGDYMKTITVGLRDYRKELIP